MAFADADYQEILKRKGNEQLFWEPEEKYAQYRKVDPFPEIGDALLNSVDIVKYCMTVGMITPFKIEEVKGVTYTCHFSGKYFYWDGKSNDLVRKTDADDPELLLRPNSITYLEIDEMFRVPDYLIIRYNLQVNHVYKGLLLGTGPIVDPGFVGRLYIPLHNLTSNEYRVKKGAPLITLEFTKVGRNREGVIWPEVMNETLDFTSLHHQPEEIKPGRDFDFYLQKALIGKDLFRKTKDSICVGSSIPEKIQSAEEAAKAAEESAKKSEKSLTTTKNILFSIGIVGGIALIIAVAALLNDVNGRIDSVLSNSISISAENNRLQEENSLLVEQNEHFKEENANLQDKNAALQATIDELMSDQTGTSIEETA